jgi:MinD superfamily P-loop ATPase
MVEQQKCSCSGPCETKNPGEMDQDSIFKTPIEIPPEMPEGLKIFIDPYKCSGCGICGEVCPFGLPQCDQIGKFTIERVDLCVGCSACQRNCPTHAIYLQEQKGCGCLWNVVSEKRNNGKNSCCE